MGLRLCLPKLNLQAKETIEYLWSYTPNESDFDGFLNANATTDTEKASPPVLQSVTALRQVKVMSFF